jgi:hypothetical protein
MKDKKNCKIKAFLFTPIVPHPERDLQVRFLLWRKNKWSANCNKFSKNLLD